MWLELSLPELSNTLALCIPLNLTVPMGSLGCNTTAAPDTLLSLALCSLHRQGFPASALLMVGLDLSLLTGRPVHCKLVGSVPHFNPLDAGSTLPSIVSAKDVSRLC